MAADAMKRCRRGFTLIELMVVVTVVSILASIALPSYQNSVRKTRRTDARIALTELAHKLERCQTQFGSYDDPACSIASPDDSPGGHYQLTVVRDAGSFTVSATIQGVQTDDRHCASFSLDSRGERRASDGDGSAAIDCW